MPLELVLITLVIGALLLGGLAYWFWGHVDRWSFGLNFFEHKKGKGLVTPPNPQKIRRRILRELASSGELCLGQLSCDIRVRSKTVFEALRELEKEGKVEPRPEKGKNPYERPYLDEVPWALKL